VTTHHEDNSEFLAIHLNDFADCSSLWSICLASVLKTIDLCYVPSARDSGDFLLSYDRRSLIRCFREDSIVVIEPDIAIITLCESAFSSIPTRAVVQFVTGSKHWRTADTMDGPSFVHSDIFRDSGR
jgi:hypothetical protein